MRAGQRYLLVKLSGPSGSLDETERWLAAELEKLLGQMGTGRSGYKFVRERFDPAANTVIIKTTISGLLPVRAAMCLMATLGGRKAKADVLRVSGTIKGALRGKE
jgi:RNase P/RNase MRP subunit POP5